MLTVLFIAADHREFAGLLPRLKAVERLRWPVDWARTGELNGRRVVLAANGPGPALAADAARQAVRRAAPDVLVSTGFCGALNPAFRVGDVFVPSAIQTEKRTYPAEWPAARGVLLSLDRVVQTAGEKRVLFARGADAVEMEAAGVAEVAAAAGLPLYAIRAVTDLANENFAIDFNRARRDDGHFSAMRIVAAGLRHPRELARLARRARMAARNLGEFIADCKF